MKVDVWKVVVIDDSPEDRAEVRRLLLKGSDRRYQFTEAETGAAGVRAVLDAASDCVVLDYNLPDMNALEVLAGLVGPDGSPTCPVVVLTGSSSTDFGREVLRAGAQDFLGKSWMTAESLSRAVENAAERWAMARELNAHTAALQASDEWLRLATRVAELAVAEIDYAADTVRLSPEAAALFGLPADPPMVPRAAVHALFHPADRAMLAELIAASCDPAGTGEFEVEHRIVRLDGAVRWLGVRKRVFFAAGRPTRGLLVMFDCTGRKEAEEQLRRAHDTFYHLIANNPFGIYVVDADFRLRQVSQGAQGVFRTVRPLLGRDFAEVLHSIWSEPFSGEAEARFRHTLTTGEPYTAVTLGERRVDIGDVEAYDWRIERVSMPDGRFGVVCYFYDLTERRRWEEALRASERDVRSLTDNSPDILTRFDRELRYVFVNVAIERASGRPAADLIGKTNRELGVPDHLCEVWDAAVRGVFDDGRHRSLDFSVDAADGRRHYAARVVPEFGSDGVTVESVLGVTRDVTDARVAEGEVRDTAERLRVALAAAQAGTWAWDVPTGAITWSPENFALYGYDPAGDPPAYANWEERLHPDDRGRANAAVRDALETGTEDFRSEFRVTHPTRGIRWLLGLGKVEFGPAGKPVRMAGINLDITERKHLEAALHDADRRKDEFLATLAHELRNPLAPICTGLDVMRMSSSGTPAVEKARAMMERQLGHMVRLVDDLMDVSRISRGKVDLKVARVQARAVLDHAVEASRPLIEAEGHALVVDAVSESVWVDGDLTRLAQVVSNLLNNAAKYTPAGGRIELAARVEAGEVVIAVIDNGAGIAAEMLPNVFDLFAQVDRTLDRAKGGLGIGLSLVQKLVALHGGTVTAASAGVGFGSTFTVRLPRAAEESSAANKPSTPRRPNSLRVLVVDDNVDGAEMLSTMLKLVGHEARAVHDGPAALAAARDVRPDVVFLDIGLPGMSGHDVAKRFRAETALAGIVLVALTGWGSEDDKRKSREAGFDHHVTKPIDFKRVQELFAGISGREP